MILSIVKKFRITQMNGAICKLGKDDVVFMLLEKMLGRKCPL